MKDELVDKIERVSILFNQTERDDNDDEGFFLQEIYTTYLMVQLRKILERNKNKNKGSNYSLLKYCKNNSFAILLFYINWLLHPKKSRMNNEDEVVDILKDVYKDIKNYSTYSTKMISKSKLIKEVINMSTLKNQINSLMEQENIQNYLVEDSETWNEFVNSLQNILADQPIENKDKEDISSVRFKSTSRQFIYYIIFECKDRENKLSYFIRMLGRL